MLFFALFLQVTLVTDPSPPRGRSDQEAVSDQRERLLDSAHS